jgi:hypothetical protein
VFVIGSGGKVAAEGAASDPAAHAIAVGDASKRNEPQVPFGDIMPRKKPTRSAGPPDIAKDDGEFAHADDDRFTRFTWAFQPVYQGELEFHTDMSGGTLPQ